LKQTQRFGPEEAGPGELIVKLQIRIMLALALISAVLFGNRRI
jgi:hypothetical protein